MRVTEWNEPGPYAVQSRCEGAPVEKLFVEAVVTDGECQGEFSTVLHWLLRTVAIGPQRDEFYAFVFTETGWNIISCLYFNRERKSRV